MFHKPRNTFHNNAKQTKFKKASVDQTTVDKVSEMPELADVVPELVCLGIDVAICGVISPGSHLTFPQQQKVAFKYRQSAPESYYDSCQAVYTALRDTSTVLRQLSAAPELQLNEQLVARFH